MSPRKKEKAGAAPVLDAVKLFEMKTQEIMEFFSTLPPPDFSEMNGEYSARLLDHGSRTFNLLSRFSLYNPGVGWWLGKAFLPETGKSGHGYNMFERWGRVFRKYRMLTDMVPSRFDQKPVFRLYYAAFRSPCGLINMVDEVRKVKDGLYLGIGAWGFSEKMLMRPLPFILDGPIGPFVGPDGEET
jgi:hypothetical protein